MPDDDRLFDSKLNERLMHKVSLSHRCPTLRPCSVRVTEARAIERNNAVSLGQPFEYPANLKVLHHSAIAVQQDKRWAFASLEVMQVDPLDTKEAAGLWVVPLRLTCASSDQQSRRSPDGRCG